MLAAALEAEANAYIAELEQFLSSAAGLSPATVTRLTAQWQADHSAFQDRDLSATDYVYVWADGVHLRIRLGEAKAAVLVLMGVRADGTKELTAMTDATANPPRRGPGCCGTAPAGACAPRSWPSATALSASGTR